MNDETSNLSVYSLWLALKTEFWAVGIVRLMVTMIIAARIVVLDNALAIITIVYNTLRWRNVKKAKAKRLWKNVCQRVYHETNDYLSYYKP